MSQAVKELLIRINGQLGSGAKTLSGWVSNLGNSLEHLGTYTREFESESLNIYRSYEDEMLSARTALMTKVDSMTELERQMKSLDVYAQKWAANTIFHTSDVSKAINQAATAGWDFQEIIDGLPQAMLIAQAGGMGLAEGLDYLVTMMGATQTPFENIGQLVDEWAKSSKLGATNISEMGQAFQAMGSSAMFGDDNAELFTMLTVLANVGTKGSEAGTALRSAMMRLVAPTMKAEAAMSLLGADASELEETLSDESVTKAAKKLQGLGFSAYDSAGQLKPMRQIFGELFDLTNNLDENTRMDILGAIFPSRTIATGLALLNAGSGELNDLYQQISESGGFAQSVSDVMMSGLTGALETLSSKWEAFQLKIGEMLTPFAEDVANVLIQLMDQINSLPPEVLNGLTTILTTLSTTGPLLIGVGAVSGLLKDLGPLGTAALVAGIGISFLYGYITKLNEMEFESHFGDLQLDIKDLGDYVDSVKTKFDAEKSAISEMTSALQDAETKYQSSVTSFNEALVSKVIKGDTFTEADYQRFDTLGSEMVKHTLAGIDSANDRDQTFLHAIFGSTTKPEEIEALDQSSAILDYYYGDLGRQAKEIGEWLREKYTEALKNGNLTPEDEKAIQAQVSRLNQINAEILSRQNAANTYAQYERASRVSWDSINAFLTENAAKYATEQANIETQYDDLIGTVHAAYETARKTGNYGQFEYIDSNGDRRIIDLGETAEDSVLKELREEREKALDSATEKYGSFAERAFDTLMGSSTYADAWEYLKDLYASGNEIPRDEYGDPDFYTMFGGRSREELETLARRLADISKDSEKLKSVLNPFVSDPAVYAMMRALEGPDGFNLSSYLHSYLGLHEGEVALTPNDEDVEDYKPPTFDTPLYVHPTLATGDGDDDDISITDLMEDSYANGGRADSASVFGEAGPEWAIPEAHTARTASLLTAAANASGFTWGPLQSSGSSGGNVTVNYSPIINSGNAGNIASVLAADKERLIRMIKQALDEARFLRSVEVYA